MSKNVSLEISKNILNGFEKHYKTFRESSIKIQNKFENQRWDDILSESKDRMLFYDNHVSLFCEKLKKQLHLESFNEVIWVKTKLTYMNLISTCNQPELAETFYNSVFCNLFDKRFYNNNFIFVRPGISTTFIDLDDPIFNSYYTDNSGLDSAFQKILNSFDINVPYEDFNRDIKRLKQQFIQQLNLQQNEFFEIQIIKSPFFRRKTVYLIGKVLLNNNKHPLLIALNNKDNGLNVDALLTNVENISLVFSFSRSYFFINVDYPAAVVDFLKSILPRKTKAELYSFIGLHKHGKTLLYRIFLKYSRTTDEKLTIAPGVKGMVMTVFTFPMFPYVFKVINDEFAPPKMSTRQMVKKTYFFVKSQFRIGRLADTWEFSNVAFPMRDIDDALLTELKRKVGSSIKIEGNLLIIKHLYIENKMIPLDLYVRNANDEQLTYIINDYGRAIDELINANIFPGDMLTKNFGVTRQNRVVFYDYDEITTMDKPVFRKIPPPRHAEDELTSDPWYSVGAYDIFPEEFKFFMFGNKKNKDIFNINYKKLLDYKYWQQVQDNLKNNLIKDYYPYRNENRMSEIYKNQD